MGTAIAEGGVAIPLDAFRLFGLAGTLSMGLGQRLNNPFIFYILDIAGNTRTT